MVAWALPSDTTVPILRPTGLTCNNLKGGEKLGCQHQGGISLFVCQMGSTRAYFCGDKENHPFSSSLTRALLIHAPLHTPVHSPITPPHAHPLWCPASFFTAFSSVCNLSLITRLFVFIMTLPLPFLIPHTKIQAA